MCFGLSLQLPGEQNRVSIPLTPYIFSAKLYAADPLLNTKGRKRLGTGGAEKQENVQGKPKEKDKINGTERFGLERDLSDHLVPPFATGKDTAKAPYSAEQRAEKCRRPASRSPPSRAESRAAPAVSLCPGGRPRPAAAAGAAAAGGQHSSTQAANTGPGSAGESREQRGARERRGRGASGPGSGGSRAPLARQGTNRAGQTLTAEVRGRDPGRTAAVIAVIASNREDAAVKATALRVFRCVFLTALCCDSHPVWILSLLVTL